MVPFLLFLFVVLQIADVCTTYTVIHRGVGREGNPLIAWLMRQYGVLPGLLLSKSIIVSIVSHYLPPRPLLILLCAVYVIVIINNINVIRGRHE